MRVEALAQSNPKAYTYRHGRPLLLLLLLIVAAAAAVVVVVVVVVAAVVADCLFV